MLILNKYPAPQITTRETFLYCFGLNISWYLFLNILIIQGQSNALFRCLRPYFESQSEMSLCSLTSRWCYSNFTPEEEWRATVNLKLMLLTLSGLGFTLSCVFLHFVVSLLLLERELTNRKLIVLLVSCAGR